MHPISITAVTNAITAAANVIQLNRASLTAALSRRSTPRSTAARTTPAWLRPASSLSVRIRLHDAALFAGRLVSPSFALDFDVINLP